METMSESSATLVLMNKDRHPLPPPRKALWRPPTALLLLPPLPLLLIASCFLLSLFPSLSLPLSHFPPLCPSVQSLYPEVPLWLCEFIDSWELGESRRQGWGAGSGMEIEGYKLFVTGKQ